MSTEINIKKKLAILDEGASVTTDATSIDFVGSGVNVSTIDGDVTVTIPGGSGNTTYYLNQSIDQTPYKEFSSLPTAAVEQVVPLTVSAGATSVIAEYQTPSGVPGTTQIPAGLWQLFLHFNAVAAGQNWVIRPTVYKRDLGGAETLLFTPDPEIVTGMSTTTTMYVCDGVFPATTLLTTDRIVVKISVENTTGVSQTVNFRTEASQHYSVALTTLNQVVPTGTVTSVTGTAPIASSGGTTPAISIAQATAIADGYLSSSDFAVFSAKVDKNIYTADGIVAGTRTVNLAGNNLTFNDLVGTGSFTANIDDNAGSYGQLNVSVGQVFLETVSSLSGTGKYISVTPTAINIAGYYNLPVSSSPTLNQIPYAASTSQLDFTSVKTINGNSILGSGNIVAGLTYFTEAQNTASPNATVPVDSLTAVTGTTNGDFAIIPKGNGAILARIPDNTGTGGNKRGQYALDLSRTAGAGNNYIAAGNYDIILGGTRNISNTGTYSFIGNGDYNFCTGTYGTILNGNNNSVTGARGIVLNGQYSQANGAHSVAGGGLYNYANGAQSVALCNGTTASGTGSMSINQATTASGQNSFAAGNGSTADAINGFAIGDSASTNGVRNKFVIGGSGYSVGATQAGTVLLDGRTTTNTPTVLIANTANSGGVSATTQFTLPNNSLMRVKGSIQGKQSASLNCGVWDFDAVLVRGTTASTMTVVSSNINVVTNVPVFGTPTITANTTLGCMTVTVTGLAATNIQWACRIDSTETLYA
jgi:hypothetical protein